MRIARDLRGGPEAIHAHVVEPTVIDAVPQEPNSGISLMQALAIARHYWRKILACWVIVTALVLAVLLMIPKTYTATATLVVDAGTDSALNSQTSQTDRLGSYLSQQSELMTNPVRLVSVVNQLHLTEDKNFTAGFAGDPAGLPSYAAKSLSNALQVDITPNAQFLTLSASAGSPTEAAQIANAVVDQYFKQEQGSAEQYADRLTEFRANLAKADANVAAFRTRTGVTDVSDLSSKTDTETAALDTLEDQLLKTQTERRELESRQAGTTPTAADEALASPQLQTLRAQLHQEQTDLAQLRTTYGPQHPKILALESQIATTKAALGSESGRVQTDSSTQLARDRALEAQYTQAIAAQRTKVIQLRDLQAQGSQLQLELDSAKKVYGDALSGYQQAQLSKFSNLSVVARAMPPAYSDKSKKKQYLIMGSLAGLALGIGLTFGYELLFNRRLRCRDDLERALGVRVLAQIGPIQSPPNHA